MNDHLFINPPKTSIVTLLCGLPGSGKSTLSRQLADRCQQHKEYQTEEELSENKIFRVVHIEYDEIEANLMSLKDSSSSSSSATATATADSKTAVTSEYSRNVWKQSRAKSLHLLKTALHEYHFSRQISSSDARPHATSATATSGVQLILLDDNFHLRSMRREVYRICQEFVASNNNNSANRYHQIYSAILW